MLSFFCFSLLSSSAVLAADTIAKCGAVNNIPSLEIPSVNLCSPGIASFVTNHDNYHMWTCYGSNASSSADDSVCSAPIIGKCGNASSTGANPPATGLCTVGRPVNMNWLSGVFASRKPIIVSNYADQTLNDYVFSFNVAYSIGMQSDFDDLRFVGSDGKTQLSYWIESKVDNSQATIWIRMPSIPAGASLIYMYYGNNSVSSGSNGKNVFGFFDDFSASLDTTIWEGLLAQRSGWWSQPVFPYTSGGVLQLIGPNNYGGCGVATNIRIPSDVIIETNIYKDRDVHMPDYGYPSLGVLVTGTSKVSRSDIYYNSSFYYPYVGSVAQSTVLTSSDAGTCGVNNFSYQWKRLTTKVSYSQKKSKSILGGACTAIGSIANPLKDPFLQISMAMREGVGGY